MRRILFLYLFLFLAINIARGQYNTNQNKFWAFGTYAAIDFSSGSATAASSSMSILEGCTSLCDGSGALLFYSDGQKVWDRTGTVMPNGSSIVSYSTWDAAQGAQIVPVPYNANQYYLFSGDAYGTGRRAYTVVDMSLNGGLGDVVTSSMGVALGTNFAENMTAVAGNNCDVWVLLHRRDSAAFWAYRITSAGLITSPVVSLVGVLGHYSAGVIKVSPDRTKIVLQNCEGASTYYGTELYDFDPATGVVSNCRVLNSSLANYGADFSPDNTKLYTSTLRGSTVYQYDLSAGSLGSIIASKTVVGTTSSAGDMRLAPNGKIYVVRDGQTTLDVINSPNLSGTACSYANGGFALASGTGGQLGLPNIIVSNIPTDTSYTHHDTLGCLSIGGTMTISAHDTGRTGMGYLWDDGVTAGQTRAVSSAGTYRVQMLNGCHLTIDTIHVHTYPQVGLISGAGAICRMAFTTLTDTSSGGVWTSSNPVVATVGSASGLVSGLANGTIVVTYTEGTGCYTTRPITVNPLPSILTGTFTACPGEIAFLDDTILGGKWFSSGSSIAMADSISGIITGVAAGNALISYVLPTGCLRTATFTTNPLPAAISGSGSVCAGSTTLLSDATPGGRWSSFVPTCAAIGSVTGMVGGVFMGVTIVSYTLPTGCSLSVPITVNPLPMTPLGMADLCMGSTSLLMSTGGGTWSIGLAGIASVDPSSGTVSGLAAGTVAVSYTLPTGCSSSVVVTVEPLPAPISGGLNLCMTTDTLSDAISGGSWLSGNPAVAYIDAVTGVVTTYAIGLSIITYTLPTGCSITTFVTVNPAPTAITGPGSICAGVTAPLYDGVAGGAWSSSSPAVGSVDAVSGVCAGLSAGVTTISYSTGAGCYATVPVSVSPIPLPITGTARICQGTTTTLSDATPGGRWSSTAMGVATAGSTGTITGVSAGTATISYTSGGSCAATSVVTVDPLPAPITGVTHLCLAATATLSSTTGGGVWSSGSPGIATAGSLTGIVTGMSVGTATITYTVGNCAVMTTVTVNSLPAAITGAPSLCVGTSTTLADATPGGTWSHSSTAVSISSGIVTGVSAGTSVITYTIPATGCFATRTETVTTLPAAISGPAAICSGATTILTDITAGGTWSCSGGIATIGATSGSLVALSPGIAGITYSIGTGCTTSTTITVNPSPAAIGGVTNLCAGNAIVVSDATGGGTWSGGGTAIGVSPAGVVAGMSAGTATISYTIPATGCYSTATVTVDPLPGAIAGPSAVCAGSPISLITTPTGGTWSSTMPSVASIGSMTGIVTGITTGATTIWYILPSGCKISATVTVSPAPSSISGSANVCTGSTAMLTTSSPGGVWSSGLPGIATVGSLTGVATGVTAGTATMTYSLGAGCTVTRALSVVSGPAAISGPRTLCTGATISLGDATSGGAWSSATTGVATITTSGIVSGVAAGTTTISYRIAATGCAAVTTLTVNPTPAAITGPATVCTGSAITEADAIPGGVWSSPSAVITAGSAGTVTGVSAGTALISYSIGSCTATRLLTVSAIAPITGASGLCVGNTTSLSDASGGGAWSSGSPGIATITAGGVVSALMPGVVTIGYLLPTGCTATRTLTVNTGPSAISGTLHACPGATSTLSNSAGGGTWSSGSPGIATVGSLTGTVTAMATGAATITYSLGAGCSITAAFTVNPLPAAITGAGNLCQGATMAMSDATAGGAWSSSTSAIATISAGGVVSGFSAGTTTITYLLPTGCAVIKGITVNAMPSPVTGGSNVCTGSSATLSDATPGGTWSSSASGIAMVNSASGAVTGIAAGTAIITYTLPTGCIATMITTVSGLPPITGVATICVGAATTLSAAGGSGVWSSSNTAIATVGGSGLTTAVTGVSMGTADISYTVSGCSSVKTITVIPIPAIMGPDEVCLGESALLTTAAGGGVWSSSNPVVAGIGSMGVVTGATPGTATISYSLGPGCTMTIPITVDPLPPAITGGGNICVGSTTILSAGAGSGSGAWSSGNTSVATVGGSTGPTVSVTGVSAGAALISYTGPNGCAATSTITVIAMQPITGIHPLCAWGDTMTVSNADTTGIYTSTFVSVLNLGHGRGGVTTTVPGPATVTYTIPAGCSITAAITVNPIPAGISGTLDICLGGTTTLSNIVPGGMWSSGTPAVATIGATSGAAVAVAAGATTIAYTLPTGCKADTLLRVSSRPVAGAISGGTNVCVGGSTTLTTGSAGGVWSSGTPAIAMVGSAGVVTGVAVGVASINYTVTNLCGTAAAQTSVNVYPTVNAGAITGADTICAGNSTVLTDTAIGGAWASTNTNISTISSAGEVLGLRAGTDTIMYTVANPGCSAVAMHSITVLPYAVCALGASPPAPLRGSGEVLRVWPNPNDGTFSLMIASGADELAHVAVHDVTGRVVFTFTTTTNKTANVSLKVAAGVYLISAQTSADILNNKVEISAR